MVGFRRLITSSCQARAIAVLSTCVVVGQAAADVGGAVGACPYAAPVLARNAAATSVFMDVAFPTSGYQTTQCSLAGSSTGSRVRNSFLVKRRSPCLLGPGGPVATTISA